MRVNPRWFPSALCTIFCLFGPCLVEASAADLKLRARLVWGTDIEKPDDPKLKAVEPELQKKLSDVFKWKNYFEVDRKSFAVASAQSKKVPISPKCEIEVKNLDKEGYEVKLIGEGKWRKTVRKQNVAEMTVLAGDDKDNAWFVVLTSE